MEGAGVHHPTTIQPPEGCQESRGLKVGDAFIFNHDNSVSGTYRLCRVLVTQDHTGNREIKVRVSYRECCGVKARGQGPPTIIKDKTQKLALLMPLAGRQQQDRGWNHRS